jgi:hypothetical protein
VERLDIIELPGLATGIDEGHELRVGMIQAKAQFNTALSR